METQNEVKCPVCGSTQFTTSKKGFSGKKAVAGAIVTGGIGLLAGTIGSNKIIITCLSCGHRYEPGSSKLPNVDLTLLRGEFIKSYEAGDKEAYFQLLKKSDPLSITFNTPDDAYKALKNSGKNNNDNVVTGAVFLIILIVIIIIIALG